MAHYTRHTRYPSHPIPVTPDTRHTRYPSHSGAGTGLDVPVDAGPAHPASLAMPGPAASAGQAPGFRGG